MGRNDESRRVKVPCSFMKHSQGASGWVGECLQRVDQVEYGPPVLSLSIAFVSNANDRVRRLLLESLVSGLCSKPFRASFKRR